MSLWSDFFGPPATLVVLLLHTARLYVAVLGTRASRAETDKPTEMPYRGQIHVRVDQRSCLASRTRGGSVHVEELVHGTDYTQWTRNV